MRTPLPPPPPRRRGGTGGVRFAHPLPTFRASLLLSALVAAVGIYTATLSRSDFQALKNRFGMDLDVVTHGRVWTLPVATFIQSVPGTKWHLVLLVLLSLALCEYLAGSLRATISFLLGDWVSSPLTVLILWALARLGDQTARGFLDRPDTGSSAAAHGALGAAAVLLPGRWAAVAILALVGTTLVAFTFQQLDAAIAHLLATTIGAGLGRFVWRKQLAGGDHEA